MVRIKHRYLLVHILYPDAALPSSSSRPVQPPKNVALLPDVVQFHQPSPNELTPQLLLRTIREQVALNYGDYGAGLTASGLSGMCSIKVRPEIPNSASEISLNSNINLYSPLPSRTLSTGLDNFVIHDSLA